MDAFSVLEIVDKCLNVFSLCHIKRGKRGLQFCSNKVRMIATLILLVSLMGGGLYLRAVIVFNHVLPTINISDIILSFTLTSQAVISILSSYKYSKQYIIVYFNNFYVIDKILRINNVKFYSKQRRQLNLYLAYLVPTLCFTYVFDFVTWYLSYDITHAAVYTPMYVLFLINELIIFALFCNVLTLNSRLQRVVSIVKQYLDILGDGKMASNPPIEIKSEIIFGKEPVSDVFIKRESCDVNVCSLSELSRCYIMMKKQSNFLNESYGLQVLLSSINTIGEIISSINVTLVFGTGSLVTFSSISLLPTITMVLRATPDIGLLIVLITTCQKSKELCEELGCLLDTLYFHKILPESQKQPIDEFRQLIARAPIKHSAKGFLDLDFSLLRAMFTTVVTYTIFLGQIGIK